MMSIEKLLQTTPEETEDTLEKNMVLAEYNKEIETCGKSSDKYTIFDQIEKFTEQPDKTYSILDLVDRLTEMNVLYRNDKKYEVNCTVEIEPESIPYLFKENKNDSENAQFLLTNLAQDASGGADFLYPHEPITTSKSFYNRKKSVFGFNLPYKECYDIDAKKYLSVNSGIIETAETILKETRDSRLTQSRYGRKFKTIIGREKIVRDQEFNYIMRPYQYGTCVGNGNGVGVHLIINKEYIPEPSEHTMSDQMPYDFPLIETLKKETPNADYVQPVEQKPVQEKPKEKSWKFWKK